MFIMTKILLLSNDSLLSKAFKSRATSYSIDVILSSTLKQGEEIIKKGTCDAVVVTIPLTYESCPKKIIQTIQKVNPYLPVFFLIDQLDVSMAITLTKLGAENCYSRPFLFEVIFENIQNSIKELSVPNCSSKRITVEKPIYIEASSEVAQNLYRQIDQVKDTNFKVIVYGETGSGKESVARRLCNGTYKDKPFIAVDCGCLSKELAASELFGHKKGSFSGAFEDKTGAFEEANNGTLFLDEIGNLDYSVQILLLRAIEERKIKRIGSNQEIDVNVRIIVASNEKLSEAVEKGTFREDLYYRLNEFEINIPPLRNRLEDLEAFVNFFIEEANRDLNKNITGVEPLLLEKLYNHQWNGNIRELKNVIRRGCLMATSKITSSCMSKDFIAKLSHHKNQKEFEEKYTQTTPAAIDDLKYKSLFAEHKEIMKVLREENYNKTKAANRLNINRKTLYNKLKTFDLINGFMS